MFGRINRSWGLYIIGMSRYSNIFKNYNNNSYDNINCNNHYNNNCGEYDNNYKYNNCNCNSHIHCNIRFVKTFKIFAQNLIC